MGLDMYAYRIKEALVLDKSEVGVKLFDDEASTTLPEPIQTMGPIVIYEINDLVTNKQTRQQKLEQFFYWRKHPNLHGWMAQKYFEKGGIDPMFNCSMLHLTREDLEQLHSTVSLNLLPFTEGFFFGESDGSEKEKDLDFIKQALASIAEGYRVYYRAWY